MTSFSSATATNGYVLGPGILKLLDVKAKFNADGIPAELKEYRQWVTWSSIEHDNHGTPTIGKLPVYIHGNQLRKAKWNSPQGQCTYDEALARYNSCELIHGVGFVFTKDDPFVFIDFDKLKVDDPRLKYIKHDSFTEHSQSGKGVHVFVKANIMKAHKPTSGEIEIYASNRFCAMTGNMINGHEVLTIKQDQQLVEDLIAAFPYDSVTASTATVAPFALPERVGEGARDNTMHAYCWSLFARGRSYEEALEMARQVNEERFDPPLDDEVVVEKVNRARDGLADEMREMGTYVKRFVFVNSVGKFYDLKTRTVMAKESLNMTYKRDFPGGRGQRPLLSSILADHPQFQVANDFVWMPTPFGKEEEMQFIDYEGSRLVNTWRGFAAVPIPGDVSAWLRLGLHLCGDQKTLDVVLQRLAYDVQFPHLKCNWGLVFHGIQGAGKDLFLTPISRIFGSAYAIVGDKDIKSDYDDGFVRTKMVVVNEVKGLRGSALESMKQKTASESNALTLLNPKKESKVFHPNLWSIIMNTNHPDAMKFDKAERRFYVIECKKSMESSLTKKEFDSIIAAVVEDEMHANAVMEYLMQIDLSGFNKGVVTERTQAFYNMIELTNDDLETTLGDLAEQCAESFSHEFITPDMLMKDLQQHDVNYSKKAIKVWLKKNGWAPINKKIIRRDGEKLLTKSRLYHIRHDSAWYDAKPTDLFDAIDAQEVFMEAAQSARYKTKAS